MSGNIYKRKEPLKKRESIWYNAKLNEFKIVKSLYHISTYVNTFEGFKVDGFEYIGEI